MSGQVRRLLTAAALASVVGGASVARATEPTTKELMEQIQQLQAKVQQLEANQKEQQAQTAQSADQQRAIEDVIKDAQTRSQWLENSTIISNYQNGKFILQDETGNFVLHPWLWFQPRYVTTFRENDFGAGDDTQSGFELRRMKFGFDGNVFTPKLTYLFNWGTDRNSGVPTLEEASATYSFDDTWAVRGGQLKDPLAHESMLSSKHMMAVERSYPVDIFTGGDNYVQGVMGSYSHGPWHAYGAFTDGARNNFNQNFEDFPSNNADFGVAGRVEYKFMGDWNTYSGFNPLALKHDLLVVGAGMDYTQSGDTGILLHTVDGQYMMTSGWSIYGAYLARAVQNAPPVVGAPATFDAYDWSVEGQVGYMLDRHWEPFARYSFTHFDSAEVPVGADNEVHEFTAGMNYFWHGDSAKWTADVVYLPNGAPFSDTAGDVLVNSGDNEVVLRIQFQLLI
jgi:hypothetical protein